MTDAPPPNDDDLVSAHLDGEAPPGLDARLAAEPALEARRAAFAQVADLVAAPATPPEATREAALAAALEVYDREIAPAAAATAAPVAPVAPPGAATSPAPPTAAAGPGSPAGATVTDLAARRRGRALPFLAAAAAVVILVAGIGVALRRSTTTDTTASTAAGSVDQRGDRSSSTARDKGSEQNAATADDGPAAPSAPSAASRAPTTTVAGASSGATSASPTPGPGSAGAVASFGDLGALATPDQLRRAVQRAGATDAAGGPAPSTAPTTATAGTRGQIDQQRLAAACDALVPAVYPPIGTLTATGTATYQGTDVVLLVYTIDPVQHPRAGGTTRVYAIDASCTPRAVVTF